MADFLADEASTPQRDASADIRAYATDREARKQQHLARLAAHEATERDREALEQIAEDMKAGKALSRSDVANLTREHS